MLYTTHSAQIILLLNEHCLVHIHYIRFSIEYVNKYMCINYLDYGIFFFTILHILENLELIHYNIVNDHTSNY